MPPKKRKTEAQADVKEDVSRGPKVPWTDSEKLEMMRYLLSKTPPTLTKEDTEALVRLLPGRTESSISTAWQRHLRPDIIKTGNMAKLSK